MVPKFKNRPIVIIKQGGTVKRAFNAINRTINNMTITIPSTGETCPVLR
jgi:hypothetical protein